MFKLIAEISSTDLPTIYAANEVIVLVKNVGAGKPVVWAAAQPMMSTELSWADDYMLFASSSSSTGNGTMTSMTTTSAIGGYGYPFALSGFGSGTRRQDLGSNQYRVDNTVPAAQLPFLLFGLAQTINVNGNASSTALPLNAETVPAMQSTIQNASDNVTIWLQSGVSAGQVITVSASASLMSMSGKLVVPFAGGVSTRTVRYSSASGRFELVS